MKDRACKAGRPTMHRVKIIKTYIVQVEAESKNEAMENVRDDPGFYIDDEESRTEATRADEPEDKIVYAGSGIVDRIASNRNDT